MHTKLNVPHFKQEKWYTCGPACLRMLLAHFDVIASEEELEEAFGTTELGTTPIQIPEGAYKFGMENNKVIYHDPGISDGDFRGCEVEKFLKAWNIFKNWMITCKRR